MAKHTREVWIDAPTDTVWGVLSDFGNIYIFNPGVPRSYLTSSQQRGVGTTRHCDLAGPFKDASIEERIIEWNDGESLKVEIYKGVKTPPFEKATGSFTVKEDNGGTRVRGTLEYTLKFGPIGLLMDKVLIAPQLGRGWSALFAGLKQYVETGQPAEGPRGLDFGAVALVAQSK